MRLHHVQLSMPPGGEERARRFWVGLVGAVEVPKPTSLAASGGCWFQWGAAEIHVGVQHDFAPARKAHPAFEVDALDAVAAALRAGGVPVRPDDRLPGYVRFYTDDPFGNRLEILCPVRDRTDG